MPTDDEMIREALRIYARWARARAREAMLRRLDVSPLLARARRADALAREWPPRGHFSTVGTVTLDAWGEANGIPTTTARRWAREGRIPATKTRGRWMIPADARPEGTR